MDEFELTTSQDYLTAEAIRDANEFFEYCQQEALKIENVAARPIFDIHVRSSMKYLVKMELDGAEWDPSDNENSSEETDESIEEFRARLLASVNAEGVTVEQALGITKKTDLVKLELHGGEWDPSDPDYSLKKKAPTVEEIREALRTLVEEGELTDHEAKEFNWQSMEKLFESSGWPFVGLAQEKIKSQLYSPEAPPQRPLAHADFIVLEENRRAARSCRNERDASWTELKTYLDSLIEKIMRRADALHELNMGQTDSTHPRKTPDDTGSVGNFDGIAELLSRMPKIFRRQAFLHCVCGAEEFMRMPVIIPSNKARFSVKPLEIRIPMHVPASTPQETRTILTWKYPESEKWEFDLPASREEIECPTTLLDKNLSALEKASRSGQKVAQTFLALVDQHKPQKIFQAWTNSPLTSEALQRNFKLPDNPRAHPWYEVIREARAIFRNNATTENLLQFMGLARAKNSDDLEAVSGSVWEYSPRPWPYLPKFVDYHRHIKGQTTKPCSAYADPDALKNFMKMIESVKCDFAPKG